MNTDCIIIILTTVLLAIGTIKPMMDMFASRFERKSKLKEEELRQRKLELELNLRKWEMEEQERKQRLQLDAKEQRAFLALLKPKD